jgi:ABC-type sugar transport system substrate-binding protein
LGFPARRGCATISAHSTNPARVGLTAPNKEALMKVTFLAPNVGSSGTFYDIFADILRAASAQLQVELEVVDGTKHRETMLARSREMLAAGKKPDYCVLANYMSVGQEVLTANTAAGVGTYFVAEGLGAAELGTIASAGGAGAGYLGQIVPDDVEAGKMLGEMLTAAARTRGLFDAAGMVHVGAIAGEHTQAGNARFRGWQAVLKEHADVIQAGFQYGAWEEEPAKAVAALMLKAAPQISVLWCANDAMALGALAAAVEGGRRPGKDILIGGVDLVDRALAEVASGRLEASIGGHFVDGARALVLLYDHHQKPHLTPQTRTTHLVAVRQSQAERFLTFMKNRAWHQSDFTRFSRILNPSGDGAEVSLEGLMAARKS